MRRPAHVFGGVLVGYFFGPRRSEVPSIEELRGLRSEDTVLVQRFGALHLLQDRWPILGHDDGWQREAWPMPPFGRHLEIDGKAWRVEYQNDDPNSVPRETWISMEEFRRLPDNGLLGAGAVESRLTKRLVDPAATSSRANRAHEVWHYLYFKDEETAQLVARRLQGAAYTTVVRESEPDWLVCASHSLQESQDTLEAIAESLTEMAVAEGGEYDGWERDTGAARTDPTN